MRITNRNLLIVLAVVVVAWLALRSHTLRTSNLPWNRGQAGTIFQPGAQMGGGQ